MTVVEWLAGPSGSPYWGEDARGMSKRTSRVDASRGTALWGINSLRTDGLGHLLDDLVDLEVCGPSPADCSNVKRALSKIANRAASIPDGSFWRRTITDEFETFLSIYERWNSHDGDGRAAAHMRRDTLKELRLVRNRIATRVRNNQFVLQNELDLALIEGAYTALRELTVALPQAFSSLASAVRRYDTRRRATDLKKSTIELEDS